ncbi:hypothetical protein AWN68_09995 [Roseivirga echinicomitans]|uniref:VCBS repeat-containing protein n=1 Tax=Roseivirga echinicomitans TaxID=296218 RepID=A0A150X2R3_9BACT|nr:hypothetical protein AWN68_09995 [Roseivirga echinicomitans]
MSYSNAQSIVFTKPELWENLPEDFDLALEEVKIEKSFFVDSGLNPFFLEADFNGDGYLDLALRVIDKETDKIGILIIHGKTLDTHLLGAGSNFGSGGDDYKWMKVWKLYRGKWAYKTTFTENGDIDSSEEIKLSNIAISVAQSEGASNLIVWNAGKYEWIHTGS